MTASVKNAGVFNLVDLGIAKAHFVYSGRGEVRVRERREIY